MATWDIELCEAAVVYAVELDDIVAEALEHTAYDAVASGVYDDADLCAVAAVDIADLVGVDGAVFEFNTLDELVEILFGDGFVEEYVVNLADLVLGVHELLGHVAIVGEEEDAGGVAVETPYGVDALLACVGYDVHDGSASFGVVGCGDAILGLIEEDVDLLFGFELFAVVLDVGIGRNGYAHLGHYLSVDLNLAGLDEFVGLTAAAYATHGDEAVEAQGLGHGHHVGVLAVGLILLLVVEYAGVYLVAWANHVGVSDLPLWA